MASPPPSHAHTHAHNPRPSARDNHHTRSPRRRSRAFAIALSRSSFGKPPHRRRSLVVASRTFTRARARDRRPSRRRLCRRLRGRRRRRAVAPHKGRHRCIHHRAVACAASATDSTPTTLVVAIVDHFVSIDRFDRSNARSIDRSHRIDVDLSTCRLDFFLERVES